MNVVELQVGRGRRALRAIMVTVAAGAGAIGYLSASPPPPYRALVLAGAAVSIALFTVLTLYPGRLAPRLRPTPAWWAWFGVLVAASVLTRWLGGEIWIVVTICTAASAGAGSARRGRGSVVAFVIGVGAFWLGLAAGATQSSAVAEGFACGVASLFGSQAWRRVMLIDELNEARVQLARAAVADERLRIARDLHDLLGHTLALVLVQLEVADRCLDRSTEQARAEIGQVRRTLQDSLVEIREAVVSYRQLSLASELTAAARLLSSAGIRQECDIPDDWHLPPETDAALGWVVREAVTNVVKHSRASTCLVSLVLTTDHATVGITDDGVGCSGHRAGSGLTNITDRVAALNGETTFTNRAPSGFVVRAVLPIVPDPPPRG